MENIDVELVVMVVVAAMAFACIFISGLLRGNSSPTTGEGWIEAIKKTRR